MKIQKIIKYYIDLSLKQPNKIIDIFTIINHLISLTSNKLFKKNI